MSAKPEKSRDGTLSVDAEPVGARPADDRSGPASGPASPGRGFAASAAAAVREHAGKSSRIVAFGGGTGMAALLRGLKHYSDDVTAVVTVTDNGGSSGRLRNDFDMAAPGDLRNCLLALADVDPLVAQVFQYRFQEGEFKGHNFGNLFITVLNRIVGDFEESIRQLNRLLHVRGSVIPASSGKLSLVAHHPDESKSTGEVQITRSGKPIARIELRPQPVPLSNEIRRAVSDADLFLFGPGSLYTSVIPNLLIEGLVDLIGSSGKPRVYIGNIMTQPGETKGYRLSDHIRALRAHVGNDFPDAVIAHNGIVPDAVRETYRQEGAEPVIQDITHQEEFRGVRVIEGNFFAVEDPPSRSARHDSALLAEAIYKTFLAPAERKDGKERESAGERLEVPGPQVTAHATRALR